MTWAGFFRVCLEHSKGQQVGLRRQLVRFSTRLWSGNHPVKVHLAWLYLRRMCVPVDLACHQHVLIHVHVAQSHM